MRTENRTTLYSCCCKPQIVSTLTAKGKSLPRCNGRVAVVPADAAPIRLPARLSYLSQAV